MDISLALGGGGARGLAHVGVLQVLERERFRIRGVAGTSMGGIIASLYAAGLSTEAMMRELAKASGRGLLRARPRGAGLIGLDAIAAWLRGILGERTFREMRTPLAVTAVDLETGREVVLKEGPVVEAILATIALPGIFPPQIYGGHRLVDGGVLDPVPVAPARSLHPSPTVAVSLTPPPEYWDSHESPSPLAVLPVLEVFSRLRPGQALRVFLRATEIAARNFTELRLGMDRPDVVVRPIVADVGLFDQPELDEIVARGARAMEEALPELKAVFTPTRRAARFARGLVLGAG